MAMNLNQEQVIEFNKKKSSCKQRGEDPVDLRLFKSSVIPKQKSTISPFQNDKKKCIVSLSK